MKILHRIAYTVPYDGILAVRFADLTRTYRLTENGIKRILRKSGRYAVSIDHVSTFIDER